MIETVNIAQINKSTNEARARRYKRMSPQAQKTGPVGIKDINKKGP